MNYFCEICDKTIQLKSKNIHLKSLTHIHFEKCNQKTHTIGNPDFFDIDKIFIDFITNHNKKFDLYPVICDFLLVFNNFTPQLKPDFYHNATIINLKRYLFYSVEYFVLTGYKFLHINEMSVKTFSDKRYMKYDY